MPGSSAGFGMAGMPAGYPGMPGLLPNMFGWPGPGQGAPPQLPPAAAPEARRPESEKQDKAFKHNNKYKNKIKSIYNA